MYQKYRHQIIERVEFLDELPEAVILDVDWADYWSIVVEARDAERWGSRVEDTLGLERGSFKSLYHAQNNFG